jgi:hypothetical protein
MSHKVGEIVHCRILSQYVGGYVDIAAKITEVVDDETLNLLLDDGTAEPTEDIRFKLPAYGQRKISSTDPHVVRGGWIEHNPPSMQWLYGMNLRGSNLS